MPKALADVAAAGMGQQQQPQPQEQRWWQGGLLGGACGKRGATERIVQALEVLRKHYPELPMQRRPSAAADQPTGANGMISRPVRMRNPLNRRRSSHVIKDFAFIMEGPALLHVLGNEALEVLLFETMRACSAVIACRVSPKQKALLVRCVRQGSVASRGVDGKPLRPSVSHSINYQPNQPHKPANHTQAREGEGGPGALHARHR